MMKVPWGGLASWGGFGDLREVLGMSPVSFAEQMARKALAQLGLPDDVAMVVLFLVSAEAG